MRAVLLLVSLLVAPLAGFGGPGATTDTPVGGCAVTQFGCCPDQVTAMDAPPDAGGARSCPCSTVEDCRGVCSACTGSECPDCAQVYCEASTHQCEGGF